MLTHWSALSIRLRVCIFPNTVDSDAFIFVRRLSCRTNMDFITNLPPSEGHDSTLVVMDRFTKMTHFIACSKAILDLEVANLILVNVVCLHGLPDDIISDCGAPFISHFWKPLFHILGTTTKLLTVFYSQTDGQTKGVNQVLEQSLQCVVSYQ